MSDTKKEEVILEIIVNYQDGLKRIGEYQQSIDNLKTKQAQYREELKAGTIDKDQYRKSMNETSAAIKFQQEGIRILNKELQNNVKQETASANSIDGMKARLSNLTAAYNKLGDSAADMQKKQNLGAEISTITAKLSEEEQALGNFRRQVGNYEVATKSIRGELKELTEQIGQMKLAGKEGSDEYIAILKRASEVKDAFGDAAREINVGASDTKGLDRFKGAADALAGSFTMLNSVQGIFTDDQEEMSRLVQKVQVGIGALSAGVALQNALQKEGVVMDSVRLMQSKARAAALALETKGTIGATVAQRVFNTVANANPYILLATALITIVGALVLFSLEAETAAEKQDKLNKAQSAGLDGLELYAKRIKDKHSLTITSIQDEIDLANAQGQTEAQMEPLYQRLHRAKARMFSETKGFYAEEVADIHKNKIELEDLEDQMQKIREMIANGNSNESFTIRVNGKTITEDAEDLVDILQAAIDNTNRKVVIGVTAKSDAANEQKKEEQRIAAHNKSLAAAAKEARQKELEAVRAAQDSILAIITDGRDKEIASTKIQYARQIEDLRTKLKTEKGLTATAKTAMNQQIIALQTQQNQEMVKIEKAFSAERFNLQIEEQKIAIETRLLNAKAGSDAEYQLKMQSLTLTMDEELRANADKEERLQIDSQLIKDKYATQMEVAERDRVKAAKDKEVSEARIAIENRLIEAQMAGDNELQAKLEAKQAEIAMLARLENEGDEAFLNRKLQLAADEKAIIRDIADTKRQETNDMLSAIGSAFGAISGLMEDMAEDNESLAAFSKVLAIFEIGINTAIGISNAIATATKSSATVWDMIAGIAAGVATVIAAIAQASSLVNKAKQPKAPKLNKYATGGLVSGAGSSTSDSIPAMLSSGESVLNAMTTAMFAPILSSFNQIGGGVPIQVHNTSAQVMGEDMLARAFAKGAASLPAPVVNVQEITSAQARIVMIEQLGTM